MLLRAFEESDAGQIAQLFVDTVHAVNAQHYTKPQLDAWAPSDLDPAAWCAPLARDYTLVADEGGTIIGFGSLSADGCIDRLYVHKDYQRQGVATRIVDALEAHAREARMQSVVSYVSKTARPFFADRGYAVVRENAVVRNEQTLINYLMKKTL